MEGVGAVIICACDSEGKRQLKALECGTVKWHL